jgi:hypothetical protein
MSGLDIRIGVTETRFLDLVDELLTFSPDAERDHTARAAFKALFGSMLKQVRLLKVLRQARAHLATRH